jgi:hypothetical protein
VAHQAYRAEGTSIAPVTAVTSKRSSEFLETETHVIAGQHLPLATIQQHLETLETLPFFVKTLEAALHDHWQFSFKGHRLRKESI